MTLAYVHVRPHMARSRARGNDTLTRLNAGHAADHVHLLEGGQRLLLRQLVEPIGRAFHVRSTLHPCDTCCRPNSGSSSLTSVTENYVAEAAAYKIAWNDLFAANSEL